MSTVTPTDKKSRRKVRPVKDDGTPVVSSDQTIDDALAHADAKPYAIQGHEDDDPTPFIHKLIVLITVVAPLVGFAWAINLAWQAGAVNYFYLSMMGIGWLLTGLGITIGFHRMLTHRSFDTYNWNRLMWAGIGTLALEGPPLAWCAVHRKHHQHSDQEGDPHSPHLHEEGVLGAIKGFWHAHAGWLFTQNWDDKLVNKYAPDLKKIKGMQSFSKYYLYWIIGSLALPAVIGGLVMGSWTGALLGFLWGGLGRVFLTHHVTWSVNSICHIFGKRDFHSDDDSRNNAIFGILSHGEGWHNNHHAFPTSARHGLQWWQWDTSWMVIRLMKAVGIVWNSRGPSEKAMAAKKRTG
jgi:stearoyl-CoA desaturase (delta-9 desaturase)